MSTLPQGPSPADAFRDAFGLTACETAILARLHRAGSAWVPSERLNEVTACVSNRYDHAAPLRGLKSVTVHIANLRAKIGQDAILSYWGRGYTLGAEGIHKCRAALADAQSDAA